MSKKLPGVLASEDPEKERCAVFRVEIPFFGKAAHQDHLAGKLARELQLSFGNTAVARFKKDGDVITAVEE